MSSSPRDIPPFRDAVVEFQDFLIENGHPRHLIWIFREDFYSLALDRYWVRMPLPEHNASLAESYFDGARERGIVQLRAVFSLEGSVAATPWSPIEVSEEIQGWPEGMKLSIQQPFVEARPVRTWLGWWIHRLTRAYRLNQAEAFDVPRRRGLRV